MEPGTQLGHYTVLAAIAKGGMGEVWRARDTKLGREVAIKTLPEEFSRDPDRLARFEREAKLLASLNHPNIAAIYGLEEYEGTLFLVLELVEGDTLAQRLERGAIPVESSLRLTLQIVEALEAAHEKGVVHRDLKPANIKITPDGTVKVLDFGLAKALTDDQANASSSNSPTLSVQATQQGVILGTAAYMSPEQAKGLPADRRADIFALGCVLFEMLTGRPAFRGELVSEILASVINQEPDYALLQQNLHPRIKELLRRCFEKKPGNRWQAAGDVRLEIEYVLSDPAGLIQHAAAKSAQPGPSRLPWFAAMLLVALISGIAVWTFRSPQLRSPVRRLSYVLPADQEFTETTRPNMTISPNGEQLVYAADGRLYLWNMSAAGARPIEGTDDNPNTPVFSPDGQWVAYWSARAQQLRKVKLSEGLPVPLADATNPFGLDWGANDMIVYGQSDGIWRIQSGGEASLILRTKENEIFTYPRILPGGRWLTFTLQSRTFQPTPDNPANIPLSVMAVPLSETGEANGERKTLQSPAFGARYLPGGYLTFVSTERELFAAAFDPATAELLGDAVPVEQLLRVGNGVVTDPVTAFYDFSDEGTFVYQSSLEGSILGGRNAIGSPVFVDLKGNPTPVPGVQPRVLSGLRFSPAGDRIALGGASILDLDSGGETEMPLIGFPVWLGDGQGVIGRGLQGGIARMSFDNPSQTPLLPVNGEGQTVLVTDVTGNGLVLFHQVNGQGDRDIYTLSLNDSTPVPRPFCVTDANERAAVFNPEGSWLAYVAPDSEGKDQIWAQRLIDTCPDAVRYKVSDGGGIAPMWAPSGDRIYYLAPDGNLYRSMVRTEPTFQKFGPAQAMFRVEGRFVWPRSASFSAPYDVDPAAGNRFIFIQPVEETVSGPKEIHVVLNWFEELKARVPTTHEPWWEFWK